MDILKGLDSAAGALLSVLGVLLLIVLLIYTGGFFLLLAIGFGPLILVIWAIGALSSAGYTSLAWVVGLIGVPLAFAWMLAFTFKLHSH